MKKLLIVFFGFTLLSIGLSGCSNKYSTPLHSVKYYAQHPRQGELMLKLKNCEKMTPFELKHGTSNLAKDCLNARIAKEDSFATIMSVPNPNQIPGPPTSSNPW